MLGSVWNNAMMTELMGEGAFFLYRILIRYSFWVYRSCRNLYITSLFLDGQFLRYKESPI